MTSAEKYCPHGIILRDYQENAIQSVLEASKRGINRSAVVLATGGGKTVVLSALIPQLEPMQKGRTKTLVLAHKEELIRQAAHTIARVNPHLDVQIDMQKSKPDKNADVVVASVPTLVRMTRLERYDPSEYKSIILDECHHATARSWTKILEYFGALGSELKIHVIGFTATLERADGEDLGTIFQEIVYQRSLLTMIKNKELCDIKFSRFQVNMDLNGVPTRFGDYVASKLSGAVNNDTVNLEVVQAYHQLKKEWGFRATLIFCVDINHCKTLCSVLQENGVNAQYVTGETVRYERQAILQDFKEGKIEVLCNVIVFTEGTDIPNIDSIILARPTKSRPLLVQMIGRGLRLHPGKDFCHVIDMVDVGKLGVLSVPTLFDVPDEDIFEGKSLLELEETIHERQEEEGKKAEQKAQEEAEKITQLQEKLQGLQLKFETIEGFASLETSITNRFEDPDMVKETFRRSRLKWVRLEYNIWGVPDGYTDVSYLVKYTGDPQHPYLLIRRERAPLGMLIASGYRCPRHKQFEIAKGELPYMVATAENKMGRITHRPEDKRLTRKQVEVIVDGLESKVRKEYGNGAVAEFRDEVGKLLSGRGSRLIFAMKYSYDCLWVRWELRSMLGSSPTIEERLEKDIRTAQHDLNNALKSQKQKQNITF